QFFRARAHLWCQRRPVARQRGVILAHEWSAHDIATIVELWGYVHQQRNRRIVLAAYHDFVPINRFTLHHACVEPLELLATGVVGKSVDTLREDVVLFETRHPCALPVPFGDILTAVDRKN